MNHKLPELIADRYETGEFIGQGAMGEVFKGLDRTSGETVAIKVLRSDVVRRNPGLLERFLREGEALRQLNHPNIVRMIDAFEDEDRHYIVMEHVPSGDLRSLLHETPQLPVKQALKIILELADALSRAHHLGIIHRDIKPANVLIAEDGTPRLTDFGIAHLHHSKDVTETGVILGTYTYLSPEACMGEHLDARSDIWSLGIVLYEMLIGSRPFEGNSPGSIITKILMEPVPDINSFRSDTTEDLQDIIHRMLTKSIESRIPSARLVGAEIEGLLKGVDMSTHQGYVPTPTPASSANIRFATPTPTKAEVKSNLPAQTTPFIGREQQLEEIAALLADKQSRLLTLLGPGGMGKTRLALEVAKSQLNYYPDGVFFVPLAPLDSADFILSTIADSVGYTFHDQSEQKEQLLDFLQDRQILLVVDNFEHVLDGAGLLSDILTAAARLSILVTSRTRLTLQEEEVYEIGGMDFPEDEDQHIFEEFEAVEMFITYARRSRPGYELKDEDKAAVVGICQLVGGMPLGVELAAAWVRMLDAGEIAEELAQDVDFLETTMKGIPDRHRSMRAVFDYSWNLLDEAEKAVFPSFAVFRGGFERKAVKAITGVNLMTLLSLVDKSLLHRGADGHFSIHEAIRQFAEEKLKGDHSEEHIHDDSKHDEYHTVRDNHAFYYASFLKKHKDRFNGPHFKKAIESISKEWENIRHAWLWMATHSDESLLGDATRSLSYYCASLSLYDEGKSLIVKAIEAWQGEENDLYASLLTARSTLSGGTLARDSRFEADLLHALSILMASENRSEQVYTIYELLNVSVVNGKFDQAIQYSDEMIALTRDLNDPIQEAIAILSKIYPMMLTGKLKEIQPQMETALQTLREHKTYRVLSEALFTVSFPMVNQGNFTAPLPLIEEALSLAVELGSRTDEAQSLMLLTFCNQMMGNYAKSRKTALRSANLFRELGVQWGLMAMLSGLSSSAYDRGDYAEALKYGEEGMAIIRGKDHREVKNGLKGGVPSVRASLATALGDYDLAFILHSKVLEDARKVNLVYTVAGALNDLGDVYYAQSRLDEAEKHYAESLDIYQEVGDPQGVAFTTLNLGRAAQAMHNYEQAKFFGEEALEMFNETGFRRGIAFCESLIGQALVGMDDLDHGRRHLIRGLKMAVEVGLPPAMLEMVLGMAGLLSAEGHIHKSVMGFTLVHEHPASWQTYRDRAEAGLGALRGRLTPADFDDAQEHARSVTLDDVVAMVLGEGEK